MQCIEVSSQCAKDQVDQTCLFHQMNEDQLVRPPRVLGRRHESATFLRTILARYNMSWFQKDDIHCKI